MSAVDNSNVPHTTLHISNLPAGITRGGLRRFLDELCPSTFVHLSMLLEDPERPEQPTHAIATLRRSALSGTLATLSRATFLDRTLSVREEGKQKERKEGLQLYITGVYPDVTSEKLASHVRQCCPGAQRAEVVVKQGQGAYKGDSRYALVSWEAGTSQPDALLINGTQLQGLCLHCCHLQDGLGGHGVAQPRPELCTASSSSHPARSPSSRLPSTCPAEPAAPITPCFDALRPPRDRTEASAWLAAIVPLVQKQEELVAAHEQRLRMARQRRDVLEHEERKLLTCIVGDLSSYRSVAAPPASVVQRGGRMQ